MFAKYCLSSSFSKTNDGLIDESLSSNSAAANADFDKFSKLVLVALASSLKVNTP